MSEPLKMLAFDFGAESGRAIVGTLCDDRLSLEEIHRFKTGYVEVNGRRLLDVLAFYQEMLIALRKYVTAFGSHMDSIGVDTWACDYAIVDRQGNLLSIPYSYRDPKNNAAMRVIDEKLGREKLYSRTGIQMLHINTLNQMIALQQEGDIALQNADGMMYIGDLMHYFLTGRRSLSYTVNSISQLYNPIRCSWDDEIFEIFGIPRKIQSDMIRPGDRIGVLKPEICKSVGLEPVPVIAPCIHDTASAAVAAPVENGAGVGILSSGTWSIACLDLDRIVINEMSARLSVSNSGYAFGRNLFAKNVMGLWILQSCKRLWERKHPDLTYPQIAQMAAKAQPFARRIHVDDDLFFNPPDMLEALQKYLQKTGQAPVCEDDIGLIARIICEGLAMKYRYNYALMNQAAEHEMCQLSIIGGGCNNALLNQFTANALNIPVLAGPSEATAIGNLMMQATGLGRYQTIEQIRKVVRASFEIQAYSPENIETWDREYRDHFLCLIENRQNG